MSDTRETIQRLIAKDPTPVEIPRGILGSLFDNFEIMTFGSNEDIDQALVEYLRDLIGSDRQGQSASFDFTA